jgi:uncharacterized DUF497 family protein
VLTYNNDSLTKHGITTIEVDEVLNDPRTIWLDMGISHDGNDRLMFVGLTKATRILEVGIELIGENEYVFHAMDAGKRYIKEFNDAQ